MVKSIIKKIIVGVGIALCLMALKHGGLIANIYAKSDVSSYSLPITGGTAWVSNNNSPFNLTPYLTENFTYGNLIYRGNSQGNGSWNEFCSSYNLTNISEGYYDISVGAYFKGTTGSQNLLISINNTSNNSNFTYLNFSGISGTNSSNPTIGSIGGSKSNVYLNHGNYRVCYRFLDSISLIGPYGFSNLYLNPSSNNSFVSEQQKTTDAVNKTNDTLNDQSDANTSGFLQDINQDYSNNPVSDLITMPITFLQTLNNNASGSCITWDLGSLFDHNLKMPCINLQQTLGSNFYNLIDMAICLFLAYNIGLMCVTIWNNMTSLKDDFDDMYSPKHVYQGEHSGGDN